MTFRNPWSAPMWAKALDIKLDTIIDFLGEIMTDQDTLNAFVEDVAAQTQTVLTDLATIATAVTAVSAEIAALQAQPAAAALDFTAATAAQTALDSAVASLTTSTQSVAALAPVVDPSVAPTNQ